MISKEQIATLYEIREMLPMSKQRTKLSTIIQNIELEPQVPSDVDEMLTWAYDFNFVYEMCPKKIVKRFKTAISVEDAIKFRRTWNSIRTAFSEKDYELHRIKIENQLAVTEYGMGLQEKDKRIKELETKLDEVNKIVTTWKIGERGCTVFDDVKVITDIIKLLKEEK